MTDSFQFHDNKHHLTKDNWREYYQETGPHGICGFLDGTKDAVIAIEQILQENSDIKKIKEQLSIFVESRKELAEAADSKHWALCHSKNNKTYEAFVKREFPRLFKK